MMILDPPDIHYSGDLLAGVDEAGRGPLAGDVVAAAVILDPNQPIEGLADSKKISEAKRDRLFVEINEKAIAVAIGRANVAEIDELNILWASMLAMKRAVEALATQPEHVVVDGNRVPKWAYTAQAFVKGDQRIACISAGSIIAKVTRDRDMLALAREYPQYDFDKHKGYPTAAHRDAIVRYGVTKHHRTTFGPVRAVLEPSS
ncbi:MAG: ribonuclease HII [Pseudomonadales bacterium]